MKARWCERCKRRMGYPPGHPALGLDPRRGVCGMQGRNEAAGLLSDLWRSGRLALRAKSAEAVTPVGGAAPEENCLAPHPPAEWPPSKPVSLP